MSNRYLVKIASDLTKKERRLLDNGRDRYVNQAALWSTAGGVGTALYQAAKEGTAAYKAHPTGLDSLKATEDFIKSKVPGVARKVRNATLAFGAGGAVLAANHNYKLNKLKKSHPQEYDMALAGSDRKGYIASSLNSGLAGSAMGGLAIPAVVANVAETAYNNHLVNAARKRQMLGYEKTAADKDLDSYAAGYKSPITPTYKAVAKGLTTGALVGGLSLIPHVVKGVKKGIHIEAMPAFVNQAAKIGANRIIGGGVAGALAGSAYAHHAYVKPHLAHHVEHEDVSGIDEYRLKHIDNTAPEYAAGVGGAYLGGKLPVTLPKALESKVNPAFIPMLRRAVPVTATSIAAAYGAKKAVDHYNSRLLEHIKAKHEVQ